MKSLPSPRSYISFMKKIFLSALIIFTIAAAPALATPPKLVVTILVDQMRYDYLERFRDQFSEGGFRMLTDKGAFMTFAHYDYSPTVTGPGHASFLSGSTPSMHGIIGNDWFDKRTQQMMYCVSDSAVKGVGTETPAGQMSPRNFIGSTFADQMRLHYQSKVVGISMKDRGAILPSGKKPAGAYWFESASGNFITSSYYMAELPAWVQQFNARKRAAEFIGQKWDRLLDSKSYLWPDEAAGESYLQGEKTVTFPHTIGESAHDGFETIMPTPFGNQILLELAKAAIDDEHLGQGKQPDVLCVSFSSVDYAGHRFGPYSQEVQDIVLRLDRQLEDFFKHLDKKIGLNNVIMVLTADHGVAPTPEFAAAQGLDGQRADSRGLMLDLVTKLNERFGPGKYLLPAPKKLTPAFFDGNLYFNAEALREKQITSADMVAFIREWAFDTGKFQAVFGREQLLDGRAPGMVGQRVMNGFNGERSGDVVLVFKPFTIPMGGNVGTTHGSPYSYDTHVPVIFYGASFQTGRYDDTFYITDIAPTLCASLQIEQPPSSMGRPFVKALKKP